jgi:hypothetical protein
MWQEIVFVVACCSLVYFARQSIRAYQSPEFRRDMERLREQRRRRSAARRKP